MATPTPEQCAAYQRMYERMFDAQTASRMQERAEVEGLCGGLGTLKPTTPETALRVENDLLKQRLDATDLEMAALRTRVRELEAQATPTRALDGALKALIALAHPDTWPENPLAHDVTVRLNALREGLRRT